MKKLIALSISLAALAPASALAQAPNLNAGAQGQIHSNGGEARAEASASSSPRGKGPLPKLGPAVRNIASSTRAELKGTVSAANEQMRAKVEAIKSLIEKKRGDMKKRAEDAKSKARERFGAHMEELVGRVSDRLATSSAKLGSIADRIDARIDAFADQGHDMSGSIALLATARADISAANDKILAVNTALQAAMSTTTPKGQIPAVRAAVKSAEDALKLAKDDLMKTLRSVKVEAGATTTVSH